VIQVGLLALVYFTIPATKLFVVTRAESQGLIVLAFAERSMKGQHWQPCHKARSPSEMLLQILPKIS
jgi:hypothetical protein